MTSMFYLFSWNAFTTIQSNELPVGRSLLSPELVCPGVTFLLDEIQLTIKRKALKLEPNRSDAEYIGPKSAFANSPRSWAHRCLGFGFC